MRGDSGRNKIILHPVDSFSDIKKTIELDSLCVVFVDIGLRYPRYCLSHSISCENNIRLIYILFDVLIFSKSLLYYAL